MTVVNKYVVSGDKWNLNFLYLALQVGFFPLHPGPTIVIGQLDLISQSFIGTLTILACKKAGFIPNLTPYNTKKAQQCKVIFLLPVSIWVTN